VQIALGLGWPKVPVRVAAPPTMVPPVLLTIFLPVILQLDREWNALSLFEMVEV
jgi:hypothetical protein